jgi:DNA-binding transcriptional MerR regulator
MRIGELARHSGLAPSRIRFYEARGLIRAERLANGYRQYGADAVQLLDIITSAQRAGFALEEIRELMPVASGKKWRRGEMLAALQRKITEVDAMQQRLRDTRAQLLAVIEAIESEPEASDTSCDANANRVIARLRKARTAQN